MKAVIVGAGTVGQEVARMLAADKHEVTLFDESSDLLSRVHNRAEVRTIEGSFGSAKGLDDCEIRHADLLVAVTNNDEMNILTCLLADRLGFKGAKAVKVAAPEPYEKEKSWRKEDYGIEMLVKPEESITNQILRLIRRAGTTDIMSFADGKVQLVGIRLDQEGPVGKTLMDLTEENKHLRFRIMAMQRNVMTLLPRGDTVLEYNDHLFIIVRAEDAPAVVKMMGKYEMQMQDLMILGGTPLASNTAVVLSQDRSGWLGRKGRQVKLIEPDLERANRLAEKYPDILVLYGKPNDTEFLENEGMHGSDAVIALTDDEALNMAITLRAKHMSVRKTIALLNNSLYVPMAHQIGLDAAVNADFSVARDILSFVRGQNVHTVATVHGLDLEVFEIEAQEKSPITKRLLMGLLLPRGVLIGAVIKGNDVLIATGETQVNAGDRVIVFALPHLIKEARYYFEG